MSGTAYQKIITALESNGSRVRTGGQRAQAQCPAHEDRNPSLRVTGIEGSVLLYCHAGCDVDDVLGALSLGRGDLYDEDRHGRFGKWNYVTTYAYDNGRIVHRTAEKQFPQSGTDKTPELYRVERVKQVVRQRKTVYVVEGEKDVQALESVDVVATCSPMGAGKWSKVDPTPLHGAAAVIVVADKDDEGLRHAREIEASLTGHTKDTPLSTEPSIEVWVRDITDAAPTLTPNQLDKITQLLRPAPRAAEPAKRRAS